MRLIILGNMTKKDFMPINVAESLENKKKTRTAQTRTAYYDTPQLLKSR